MIMENFVIETWFYAGVILAFLFLAWAKFDSKKVTVSDAAFSSFLAVFGYFSWICIAFGILFMVFYHNRNKKIF